MKYIYLLGIMLYTFACPADAHAQIIQTVAGTGVPGFSGDGASCLSAKLDSPSRVTVAGGNIYISDGQRIRMVNVAGIITTIAGTGAVGYSGDGGPATAATLNYPSTIVVDHAGNILFADGFNSCIRMINTSGVISTIAGTGVSGFSGDGGPATAATFNYIFGLAQDSVGNLYVTDNFNYRIRKISTFGIVSTIAGSGVSAWSGDGGPATAAGVAPFGVSLDAAGNVYIADDYNNRVRKVSTSGIITTVAGNGTSGYTGDGGWLRMPVSVVLPALL